MKKALVGIFGVLAVIGVVGVLSVQTTVGKGRFTVQSCVSEETADRVVNAAGQRGMEDMRMQVVYQLAKRSVVEITVKDSAGSGILWDLEDGIVIVSNRHLLMRDVKAEVLFGNGETFTADVIGYSQQYDLGFIKIPADAVTNSVLREIYEVVPDFYEVGTEEARAAFAQNYAEKRVLQMGASHFSTGTIRALQYMPLFNTVILETACFSKAGMSGGGVFGEAGKFLGLISGGDVPEDATRREAEITYSIPSALIAAEYEMMINDKIE